MKHLKLFEEYGIWSKVKKAFGSYRNYFSDEEFYEFVGQFQVVDLVKVTRVGSFRSNKEQFKSIEIFFGSQTRSSISPQYIYVSKQDNQYKLIDFEAVNFVAQDEEYRTPRFDTMSELFREIKKRLLNLFIATFVIKKYQDVKNIDLRWNRIQISEEQYLESRQMIEDYSILRDNKIHLERLKMLMVDEIGSDYEEPLNHLVEYLKKYFQII